MESITTVFVTVIQILKYYKLISPRALCMDGYIDSGSMIVLFDLDQEPEGHIISWGRVILAAA